jgi:hypothetical protein
MKKVSEMSKEETTFVWDDFTGGSLLYAGTMEEVTDWLKKNISSDMSNVSVELNTGGARVPVSVFLEGMKISDDTKIQARRMSVLQLVMSAMRKQDAATYHGDQQGMDLVAEQTAEQIDKLYQEGN